MNRKTAPKTNKIGAVSFIAPEAHKLNKQTNLLWMGKVPNETTRIDLYFNAGLRNGKNATVSMTSSMLLSGTKSMQSTEIHSRLDDLGAFFDIGLSHEGVMISLYALKKNMLEAFKVLFDSIQNASFPEDEFEEIKAEKIQNFRINMNRVSVLAQRSFQQHIYHGTGYAELSEEIDFQSTQQNDLKTFHQKYYQKGLFKIAIVGALNENHIEVIKRLIEPHIISESLSFLDSFLQ